MRTITLNSFRRITSNGAYIPEVDGLRFVAILSVIVLHCYAELLDRMALPLPSHPTGLFRLLGHGGYGVEVFFSISGFILALPFARHALEGGREIRLSAYFLRRLTRLEPPYILWLLIRSGLLLAAAVLPLHFLLTHLLASIFYAHNITFGIASRIEAVSWTLEIEVQFYCLAPLLALIYKIRRAWARRGLLIVAIAAATPLQRAFLPGWNGPQNTGAFTLSILAAIQFFLVGLLVADLYADGWQRIPRSGVWDVLGLLLWPLMFWLQPHAFRFLGPLILPIVFVGAFKGRWLTNIFRHPLISTIGGMCYSIYLTHRTTILLLQLLLVCLHLSFVVALGVSLLLIAPAAIVAGAVYFLLIERPCMDPRWPQKLLAHMRSGPGNRPPTDSSPSDSSLDSVSKDRAVGV